MVAGHVMRLEIRGSFFFVFFFIWRCPIIHVIFGFSMTKPSSSWGTAMTVETSRGGSPQEVPWRWAWAGGIMSFAWMGQPWWYPPKGMVVTMDKSI